MLAPTIRETFEKFFRDRGTHLAAMIAYFALLSFFPLTFLAFAILGLTGRANESSYVVTELKHAFPGASISQLVRTVRTVEPKSWNAGPAWKSALSFAKQATQTKGSGRAADAAVPQPSLWSITT